MQPTAEGDAVGHVDDALGELLCAVVKHVSASRPVWQRGDAVIRCRAEERKMAHAHRRP